eukprot:m.321613 g.321613  ORF g.321613 m.321613 type:complete len:231 (-) comp16530_c1_seq12:686-1378(-)
MYLQAHQNQQAPRRKAPVRKLSSFLSTDETYKMEKKAKGRNRPLRISSLMVSPEATTMTPMQRKREMGECTEQLKDIASLKREVFSRLVGADFAKYSAVWVQIVEQEKDEVLLLERDHEERLKLVDSDQCLQPQLFNNGAVLPVTELAYYRALERDFQNLEARNRDLFAPLQSIIDQNPAQLQGVVCHVGPAKKESRCVDKRFFTGSVYCCQTWRAVPNSSLQTWVKYQV